uniref:MATH domain-containing protein n=1 Tax=Strigamia maritima TaxID=126957 RepID=T1IS08_STRMM
MYPVNCSFCNRKFIRQTMKIHKQECVRNLRWCKYFPIGCQFQGTQLETEKHEVGNFHRELMMKLLLNLQTEQSSNTSMLARSSFELLSLKDDIARRNSSAGVECQDVILQQNECFIKMKVKQDNLEEIIRKQEIEINSCLVKDMFDQQSKEMQDLKESLTTFQTVIEALTKQQTEQSDKVENHEITLNAVITANNHLTKSVAEDKKFLSNKMDDLSRKQNDLASDNDKLRKRCIHQQNETRKKLEKLENNCNPLNEMKTKLEGMEADLKNKLLPFEYIWKIKNFAQLQRNAKSGMRTVVYSDPFYSSEFGYKVRLVLYPNGYVVGKGTHLRISLQVMDGPYDDILKWPIQYIAKLSLLDQLNHKDYHSLPLISGEVKEKEGFYKPTREFNPTLAYTTFISFDRLKSLHLVDDRICFKLDLKITS